MPFPVLPERPGKRGETPYPGGNSSCAAALLYKGKGCCPNVQNGMINPVCGSKTVLGQPDLFVTFQNQDEYNCLTKGDSSWTWQYPDACICNCSANYQPFTCSNGSTYQNHCTATCLDPVNCP